MKTQLKSLLISTVWLSALISSGANAQPIAKEPVATPDNAVMLTVFLKHDQSRPLSELRAQLAKQEFYKVFPPAGVEVVSWNITMGIGQVIVLRLPASRLSAVNLALENTAWGTYRTEFFPTYDFKEIAQAEQNKVRQAQ
ncbi:hypothetical protein HBO12_00535 [Pseudomonas sp. WS 5059]|jgi:hypothetical protein|uniref:hypothetical protein n=1 Tax=unclassified Pseudomonas TaxID=196821 RepID=UPI00147644CB|nr:MULTISPECIES: hypothetical protein [unclassified Pseudomonas]NMX60792.1 hypothetical protein [Pseudomonas sp. WS 5079]NMX70099.1 hypothetical protein [Pseudomonas sp. WS 5111]NMX89019.1 hypothetical protein [Pseudomonas sp. WS 5010]NMY01422.1 hypothetical protein [Pseudomonas sp. WS 5059]NMY25664.1 hypothetical protein [Pseudomonas sp. WS 5021]